MRRRVQVVAPVLPEAERTSWCSALEHLVPELAHLLQRVHPFPDDVLLLLEEDLAASRVHCVLSTSAFTSSRSSRPLPGAAARSRVPPAADWFGPDVTRRSAD